MDNELAVAALRVALMPCIFRWATRQRAILTRFDGLIACPGWLLAGDTLRAFGIDE